RVWGGACFRQVSVCGSTMSKNGATARLSSGSDFDLVTLRRAAARSNTRNLRFRPLIRSRRDGLPLPSRSPLRSRTDSPGRSFNRNGGRGCARRPARPIRSMSGMQPTRQTPYEPLGGEAGIRSLVARFYDLMDSSPEAAHVRALHAKSLKASREKLFLFLSGWTGGPQLYVERFGHPRLRMRHFPLSIGTRYLDQWLC